MDSITYDSALNLAQAVIFGERVPNVADALVLLNWLDDHKPVHVHRHITGFMTLYNCPRCGTIVLETDHFCNGCGRMITSD